MKLTRNSLKELIRQSINELKEDSGDMDNDGVNEPDDEEYMDNKDKAIKKAMSNESKGVGGVVGMPALGQFVPDKFKK